MLTDDTPVLLYDGRCGLCHASVQRVLSTERQPTIRFAALESETAKTLSERHPVLSNPPDTVIFIEGGVAHLRSRAVFRVARHLRAPYSWLHPLRFLPAWLTDLPYRLIARLRYRIWGQADACMLPSPEQRARFLP